MLEHFEGTEMLCVSFERKNNPPIYTSDRAVLLNRDDEIVADFNQVITKCDISTYETVLRS